MKFALCTISFRHQLISFSDIVKFAQQHHFDGIELWGIHAHHLYEWERERSISQFQFLKSYDMHITMISDYLDISLEADFNQTMEKCKRLIQLANWSGAKRIRTFAGNKPSHAVTQMEREEYIERLRILCDLCKQDGKYLLLETHPNTLTDGLEPATKLLQDLKHDALKINLDFLHIWENGDDPMESFKVLEPWVEHYHLKNVASNQQLHVFQPHNVYSASGNRNGMVPLGEGAVDYRSILNMIQHTNHYGSIEWFGYNPASILSKEINWLHQHSSEKYVSV